MVLSNRGNIDTDSCELVWKRFPKTTVNRPDRTRSQFGASSMLQIRVRCKFALDELADIHVALPI